MKKNGLMQQVYKLIEMDELLRSLNAEAKKSPTKLTTMEFWDGCSELIEKRIDLLANTMKFVMKSKMLRAIGKNEQVGK